MNGIQATRETLDLVHQYLEAPIADCSPETLVHTFPGATIGSIISIYLHALESEDWCIQELIQGKQKLVVAGKYYEKWGLPPAGSAEELDWTNLSVPLEAVQAYGKEVYAATDAWLATATDADLDKEIKWFNNQTHSAAWVIADTIHVHLPFHAGEISSLKGVMGLKGLPW
jgi:hypothetical protein